MRGLERYAPLTGLLFVVFVIISTIVVGETPSADDGAAKAVGYWANNKDDVIAGAIIAAFSTVFMLWFAGVWRRRWQPPKVPGRGWPRPLSADWWSLPSAGAPSIRSDSSQPTPRATCPPRWTWTLSVLQADFLLPGRHRLRGVPACERAGVLARRDVSQLGRVGRAGAGHDLRDAGRLLRGSRGPRLHPRRQRDAVHARRAVRAGDARGCATRAAGLI